MSNISKGQMVGLIVGVLTLVSLVIGATYAYFSVTTTGSFGSRNATASAGNMASVALNSEGANLYMNLTATQMMDKGSNTTYYASASGATTTETEVTIGRASIVPTSDTNYYSCTYTLNITHSGSNDMYNVFNSWANKTAGQIILRINGTDYDFNSGWQTTVNGSFTIHGTETATITAGLRFVNWHNKDQSALAGTDINISISVASNSFHCDVVEEPQQQINWVYYGWGKSGEPFQTFAEAKDYNLSLRSNTGVATTSGIDGSTTIVEVCYEYNSKLVCARGGNTPANTYGNSTYISEFQSQCQTAGGTFTNSGYAKCQMGSTSCFVHSNGDASCSGGGGIACYVSDGNAGCRG